MPARKTRTQATRTTDDDQNKTNHVSRLDRSMREVIVAFEKQSSGKGVVAIDEDIIKKVEGIIKYCNDTGQQVSKSLLGELVRCIDTENMGRWLSTEAYVAVLRILLVAEQDTFRTQGFRLLLQAARDFEFVGEDTAGNHARKIAIGKAIRPLLRQFIQNKQSDEECRKIVRQLFTEFVESMEMSTTESPINVSAVTAGANAKDVRIEQVCDDKSEMQHNYDDPAIFDIPPDDINEEVLINSQDTRKPNVIKFSPKGPQNQGVILYVKKRKPPLGRVTAEGSPLASEPGKRRKLADKRARNVQDQPSIANQRISPIAKKKDRLQESASKPSLRPLSPTKKHQISKTNPLIFDIPTNVKVTAIAGGSSELLDSVVNYLGKNSAMEPTSRTPKAAILEQPALQEENERLIADQIMFDQYTNLEDGSIIQSYPLDEIFSSPAKPQAPRQVNQDMSKEQTSKISTIDQSEADGTARAIHDHAPQRAEQSLNADFEISSQQGSEEPDSMELQRDSSFIATSMPQNGSSVIEVVEFPVLTRGPKHPDLKSMEIGVEGRLKTTLPSNVESASHAKRDGLQTHSSEPSSQVDRSHNTTVQPEPEVEFNLRPDLQHRLAASVEKGLSDRWPKAIQQPIIKRKDVQHQLERFVDEHAHFENADPGTLQVRSDEKLAKAKAITTQQHIQSRQGRSRGVLIGATQLDRSFRRVTQKMKTSEMSIDPDKTLVNNIAKAPQLIRKSIIESFDRSSTTTEMHSSQRETSPEPDQFESMVKDLRELDENALAIVCPMISLLLKALRPILEVEHVLDRILERFQKVILHQSITKLQFTCSSKLRSKKTTLLNQVQAVAKEVDQLQELCQSTVYRPPTITIDQPQSCILLANVIGNLEQDCKL